MDHDAPQPRQYQAVLELAFTDALEARRFFPGPTFSATLRSQARHLRAAHTYRLLEAPVMVHSGRMSLSGLRGHSIAGLIGVAGAVNQLETEVAALFCDPSGGRAPAGGADA